MINKFLMIFMALGLFGVSCGEEGKQALEVKKKEVEKILFLGANIYEVKRKLEKKGIKVGDVEDLTKLGKSLNMRITLEEFEPNFLDTIGYASNPHVDLQPWKDRRINYIIVKSDLNGTIYRITPK